MNPVRLPSIAVVMVLVGTLLGVATPASPATAEPAEVVASASYPGHGPAAIATSPDGRVLLVASRGSLTKYAVGAHAVRRLGAATVRGVAARNARVLIHRDGRVAYLFEMHTQDSVVRVYNITGRAPRLVRTLTLASMIREPRRRAYHDVALSPDGRLLVLLLENDLPEQSFVTLRLARPTRPTRGARQFLISPTYAIAITPDSKTLLPDYNDPESSGIVPFGIRRDGSLSGTGSGHDVSVPEWSGDGHDYQIDKMVAGPDGTSAYVQLSHYSNPVPDPDRATAIVRVRLSDFAVTASTVTGDDAADQLFLQSVSPNGQRVYLGSHPWTDTPEAAPRSLLCTGTDLGERHVLSGLGDVRSLSVSPGGRTRGLLHAAVQRSGRHLVLAVDPR